MSQEWIEWNGGEMPVPGNTLVEVAFHNGARIERDCASSWYWIHHGCSTDIIAYRIVPKTVTRWLFRYKHAGKWFQDKRYMTEAEANDAYEQFSGYRKIASTREECEE